MCNELRLQVWRVKDGTYQLRAFNKQFVGAINVGDGIVNAVANTPREWETFQIIRNPSNNKRVHIKAYNRIYFQVSCV